MRVERVVEAAVGDLEFLRRGGIGCDDGGVEDDGHALVVEVEARVGGKVEDVGGVVLEVILAQPLRVDLLQNRHRQRVRQRFAEGAVGRGLRVQTVERQKFAGRQVKAPGADALPAVRAAVVGVTPAPDAHKTAELADVVHDQLLGVVRPVGALLFVEAGVMLPRHCQRLLRGGVQRVRGMLHLGVEGKRRGVFLRDVDRRIADRRRIDLVGRCADLKLRQIVFFDEQHCAVVGLVLDFLCQVFLGKDDAQLVLCRFVGLARIDLDGAGTE